MAGSTRTVAVVLTANASNYVAGMNAASRATVAAATDAQRLAAQGEVFTGLGRAGMAGGALVAAGLALAITKFAEFDSAMSSIQAATQESTENMDLLREAAIEAGAATAYSATEAANAIEELGKAGLSTEQILNGGLDGALTLAAAGGVGVAEAAGYAAIALKQFGLEGAQLPHVADLLAAGAGKAVGDVDDLAQALGQAGLVANGAGFSIEETTGVLAAFADAGMLGSDAGTSLKSSILMLQNPTDKARGLMEQYGLSFYDGAGEMLGFSEIAGQLENGLGGLTDETRNATLATIFGNDAIRSANVLYEQGADGIGKYIDQTNDSGYAAKVAADRMNNLAGDIEKLGGSFDTALIKGGSGANDVLRSTVQIATQLVDSIGSVPQPVLNVGLALGVAAAGVGLVGGAAMTAIPKFMAMQATLATSGISMGALAGRAAIATGALAVVTLAVGAIASAQAEAAAKTANYVETLDAATHKLTDSTRDLAKAGLSSDAAFQWIIGKSGSPFDAAKQLGVSLDTVTDAALGNATALKEVDAVVNNTNGSLRQRAEALGLTTTEYANATYVLRNGVKGESESLKEAIEVAQQKAEADREATRTSGDSTEAYQSAAAEVTALKDNLTALIDTMNKANGMGQDAVSTNSAYQSSLADVTAYIDQARQGVEGFTLGWAANTEQGAANRNMLSGLAADSQAAALAQLELDSNSEAYMNTMTAGNQLMYDQAIAFGASAEEARAFADQVYAIPDQHETELLVENSAASTKLAQFIRDLNNIPGRREVVISQVIEQTGADRGAVRSAYANGGYTPGRTTLATVGEEGVEFVSTAATVRDPANKAILEYMHAGNSMSDYYSGGAYGTPAMQYASPAPTIVMQAPSAPVGDRPITMDGKLFGMFRQMANGEAQIVVQAADRANSATDRNGWQ